MGSGHLGLRKIIKKETIYKEKSSEKHKCEYNIQCILKVINKNNNIEYYKVMKCNKCLSFKSIREPGNVQGCFFKGLSEKEKKLPLITAYTSRKSPIINFADLENVSYEERK